MVSFDCDGIDFDSSQTYSVSVVSSDQFTNCLDELLRDPFGNVIKIDAREFSHQIYTGFVPGYSFPARKPVSYVFKHGKLMEVPFDTPLFDDAE